MEQKKDRAVANCSLFTSSSTLTFLTLTRAVVTLTGVQVTPSSCTWDSAATSTSAVPGCVAPAGAVTAGGNTTIDLNISTCAAGTAIIVHVTLRCVCGSDDNFTTITLRGTKP